MSERVEPPGPGSRYLIVGGGMTGDAAARGILAEDPDASITLLTSEPHAPYDRPPLSKGLWGTAREDRIWRGTEDLGVAVRLEVTVEALDREAGVVRERSGEDHGYDRLLLATGARPRRLPEDDPGVVYFRTLEDYRRVRSLVEDGGPVAVIGGGFIGCELAASLANLGLQVTQAFPEDDPMGLLLPDPFPALLRAALEDLGVRVRSGVGVEGTSLDGSALAVLLEDGGALESFRVAVAGLGVTPRDELAGEAGLPVEDGIVVDDRLRTPDPRIFASGDVARFPAPFLGRRIRVEHEEHANESGMLAGRNMAGADERYDPLPYVYSEIGDVVLELVGVHGEGASWEVRAPGTPDGRGFGRATEDGRVTAVVLWGRPGKAPKLKRALRDDPAMDMDRIAELVEDDG